MARWLLIRYTTVVIRNNTIVTWACIYSHLLYDEQQRSTVAAFWNRCPTTFDDFAIQVIMSITCMFQLRFPELLTRNINTNVVFNYRLFHWITIRFMLLTLLATHARGFLLIILVRDHAYSRVWYTCYGKYLFRPW